MSRLALVVCYKIASFGAFDIKKRGSRKRRGRKGWFEDPLVKGKGRF